MMKTGDGSKPLSQMQERFARSLANGAKPSVAYVQAGYAPGKSAAANAYHLRQRPNVQRRITYLAARRRRNEHQVIARAVKRTEVNKEYVLLGLQQIVERSLQREPMLDRTGNPIGQYPYDPKTATRALELLGKETGMFIARQETTLKIEDKLRNMTDEERLAYHRELLESVRSIAGPPGPDVIDVTPGPASVGTPKLPRRLRRKHPRSFETP
jgi:hypothetical protein